MGHTAPARHSIRLGRRYRYSNGNPRLLEEKNMEKLRYLYYEWFQEEKESMVEMYQDMVRKLKAPMDDLMLQIFYFIRLSYHQV